MSSYLPWRSCSEEVLTLKKQRLRKCSCPGKFATYARRSIYIWKKVQWQFPQDNCPLDFYLWIILTWTTPPPPQIIALNQVLWKTIDKCFKLSHFEFEFQFREASIPNGDPNRGGIVNPLLVLWPFFCFFPLVFPFRVTKLKWTFSVSFRTHF